MVQILRSARGCGAERFSLGLAYAARFAAAIAASAAIMALVVPPQAQRPLSASLEARPIPGKTVAPERRKEKRRQESGRHSMGVAKGFPTSRPR